MKVRTQLVLTFSYVLTAVIVALMLPLAITLQRRARAELENRNLVEAAAVAAQVGTENLSQPLMLSRIVRRAAGQAGGRVIVVGRRGALLADSQGGELGGSYANPARPEVVAALTGQATSEIRHSSDLGQDIMATAVPVRDDVARIIGAVRITQSLAQLNANVHRVLAGLLAIGAVGLLAGLVLAFALANSLARSLDRLASVARRFGRGDLSTRAGHVKAASEIQQLAQSFDEMADRVERTATAQQEFVANASHQLRTPLTGVKLRIENAAADASPNVRRNLVAADQEIDRLSSIVDRLLLMSRQAEAEGSATTELRDATDRAITRWSDRGRAAGCTIEVSGTPAKAAADLHDVDQILDNLIDNAIRYAPGTIKIRTGVEGTEVLLQVRDHGPGISLSEASHVTERFYRGDHAPGRGSGLGLAIVRELAERCGGRVAIDPAHDDGTRVRVMFPTAHELPDP